MFLGRKCECKYHICLHIFLQSRFDFIRCYGNGYIEEGNHQTVHVSGLPELQFSPCGLDLSFIHAGKLTEFFTLILSKNQVC